jgi:Tn3 transposase DDE domain
MLSSELEPHPRQPEPADMNVPLPYALLFYPAIGFVVEVLFKALPLALLRPFQPTTVHADTQAQSTPVHALSFLLGIKLMPRIRNWKDVTFFRPSKDAKYRHIDALFSDTVDWQLIQDHWPDLLRVALSIKAGTISSAQLLRRLGSYSRRNRLYQAFCELGRVVRTIFLLEFLNDAKLREQITATTNKGEAYNGFAKWLNFGGEGVIDTIDPVQQEKHLKYNHLVANAAAIQNVIDLTRAVRDLQSDGYFVRREDLAQLRPYQTRRLKRFGDYTLSMNSPDPFDTELVVPFPLEDTQESAATARLAISYFWAYLGVTHC